MNQVVPLLGQDPKAMNTFVIIFRRRPPALSDADRRRLNEETSVWARTQNDAGHQLDPRILQADRAVAGVDPAEVQDGGGSVSALLFLEARDLPEATRVAEAHPGLRCGFNVEVRPWTKPGVVQP